MLGESFEKIRTFVLDIDGVLTDGSLLVLPDGLFRTMNIKDGYAIQLAIKKGYQIIIISGAKNDAIAQRLEGLGITEAHFGIEDKYSLLQTLINDKKLDPAHTLYMGDDMLDLKAMRLCQLATCPKDACIDILDAAQYVSPYNGGRGCVRDVIEKVLKLNGHWE